MHKMNFKFANTEMNFLDGGERKMEHFAVHAYM